MARNVHGHFLPIDDNTPYGYTFYIYINDVLVVKTNQYWYDYTFTYNESISNASQFLNTLIDFFKNYNFFSFYTSPSELLFSMVDSKILPSSISLSNSSDLGSFISTSGSSSFLYGLSYKLSHFFDFGYVIELFKSHQDTYKTYTVNHTFNGYLLDEQVSGFEVSLDVSYFITSTSSTDPTPDPTPDPLPCSYFHSTLSPDLNGSSWQYVRIYQYDYKGDSHKVDSFHSPTISNAELNIDIFIKSKVCEPYMIPTDCCLMVCCEPELYYLTT